ncbi:hypothetical protein SAMN05216203_0624 [Marinobacter daqiaonensis]|uniref:CAP-Gly protein n=1 Tax=Marinobacter daqiaonensis TaxID=650891 RepID=A0A1I6GZ13_9GAMM|nr:hypothetical protein [Marinobacter daqiaonensis]SFR47465.1 hypothetical protein SAMN05216203_0624 [Marinobacter daqiaonensis]
MTDSSIYTRSVDADRPTLTAIIAGTIVALGLMVLFTLLGLAIGVASLEAVGEGLGIGAAIYIVLTQIISLAAGGFTAARFMSPPDGTAAMLAGAAVWALTTLLVAFGGISAGTSTITSSTALVAQTAETTADAVRAITPDDISLPDISEIAESVSMEDLPPEVRQELEDAGITPSQLRAELRDAFRDVVSQQEMKRARALLTSTLSDIAARPMSFREEVERMLDQLLMGENAVINEEDFTEAKNALQTRLGLTDAQTQELVDEVESSFNSAVETLRQTVSDLQDRVIATANDIQSTVASAALWLFIASLLGLGAAAGAGLFGRRE